MMNKILLICILSFLSIISITAQNVVMAGDTVEINISGYKSGKIQWQFSNNSKNWTDIDSANSKSQKLRFCLDGYVRTKISSCNQIDYSDSLFFDVSDSIYSIGVFGGSVCSIPASEYAKSFWLDSIGRKSFKIETKGVGGAGFSSLTANNIPTQIRRAKAYNVYVLWASTNDLYNGAPKGNPLSEDSISQCGGINRAIKLIKEKNSNALILFFTSLPVFFRNDNFAPYVDAQIEFCKAKNIPYLDQFRLSGISYLNTWQSIYYSADLFHPTKEGYQYVGPLQAGFLKKEIIKYLIQKID